MMTLAVNTRVHISYIYGEERVAMSNRIGANAEGSG